VKRKLLILGGLILTVSAVSVRLFSSVRPSSGNPRTTAETGLSTAVSGPGQVEPVSECIQLGSEIGGKLKSVLVAEGDSIHKGQVLAVLENDDYRAQVASDAAELQAKLAALRKVVNGARLQERSEALSAVYASQAVMANTRAELARREDLFQAGVISREELERYKREYNVAKDEYQEKVDEHSLLNTPGREEDVAYAEADVQLAKAQLAEAQARYEKSFIRSPIDGIVLRKHHHDGETVSSSAGAADPILTVGDTRVLRVRVDIDEADVAKVHVGESAYIMSDTFGKRKFPGRVVGVGELLGPKTIRSDEPTERVDRKFLEALVELEPGAPLPIGLRVDAFVLADGERNAALR
jgi:HlyD family secretion protein